MLIDACGARKYSMLLRLRVREWVRRYL